METGTFLKDRYRLDSDLGGGGTGTVWRGRDLDLERDVAIKVLRTAPPDATALERCLDGHPPFAGKQFSELMHQHLHVSPLPPRVGQASQGPFGELVLMLLAKRPQDRPESAAAVAAALRKMQVIPHRQGAPSPQRGTPSPQPSAPAARATANKPLGRPRRWLGSRTRITG